MELKKRNCTKIEKFAKNGVILHNVKESWRSVRRLVETGGVSTETHNKLPTAIQTGRVIWKILNMGIACLNPARSIDEQPRFSVLCYVTTPTWASIPAARRRLDISSSRISPRSLQD
jgi:hypothetical protein